ncbi:MAG: DNA methyltransferase [Candidatus Puniceispirillales bacterium WSBS_2018_MAG_OTU23]
MTGVKGGKPTFNGKYDNGVYEHPIPRHGGQKIHPTQKPIDLFSELVVKYSNKGDMVIDPFLGSGTTGVAVVANGRNFEGCEIMLRRLVCGLLMQSMGKRKSCKADINANNDKVIFC